MGHGVRAACHGGPAIHAGAMMGKQADAPAEADDRHAGASSAA
jgi:hypothetical protein